MAEACDGDSLECPVDVLVDEGLSCRAAVSACDAEELCDGLSPDCPANAVFGPSTSCAGYRCDGTSDMCPTSCSSDAGCAQGLVCVLGQCTQGKRAFITSTGANGNLGGLDGGDALCQNLASAAGLAGTFRMWLGDATGSPSTRFTPSTTPYYRMDGVMIASSYTDLVDSMLLAQINVNELGIQVASNVPFTGTNADGTARQISSPAQDNCSAWTSSSAAQHGWCGNSDGADVTWTVSSNSGSPRQCDLLHRFYCFQQ